MKHAFRPAKAFQFALLLMLFAWAGCQKDRELTEQNAPTEPNYPITIQEAILRFSEIGISNTQSFNDSAAGRPFVDMEPQWGNAFLSHSTSGREIVIVPLPDSSLRTLNDGRVGAKLIFFKKGIDSVDVSILLYAADSSYFAAKHGQLDFEDFTGMYAFFDVKYNFSHGLFMDSGEPIVAVDSVFSGEHSVGGSLDRQDCITKLLSITYDCSVAFDGAQYCTEYFTTTECGRTIGLGGSGTGGTGTGSGTGGGGGTTGNNNSNNGNNNGGTYTNPLTNVYNVFNGSVPVDVFLANGGTLPSGFSTETVQQFIQIRNHGVNFNSAQLQWMLDHPTFVPVIHGILFGPQQGEEMATIKVVFNFAMQHNLSATQFNHLVQNNAAFTKAVQIQNECQLADGHLSWLITNNMNGGQLGSYTEILSFLNSHNASSQEHTNAQAVAKGYIGILASNDPAVQDFVSNFQAASIGDPIWGFVKEQMAAILTDLIADLIPGGTILTIGPQLLNNLEQGNLLDALWNAVDIALNEADTFIPAAKVASFGIGVYTNFSKLSKFYDAMKKAATLGDDVLFGMYQVLRNRVDDIYAKFEWVNNDVGAKLSGGNALEIWDDLEDVFPNATILSPSQLAPYEIAGIKLNNGTRISIKYGGNTNPNGYTIEFKTNGGFIYKIRFD
ncbi:MAG: hypothetical protein ACK4Q5_15875 [Saprospiraceae bacterium]